MNSIFMYFFSEGEYIKINYCYELKFLLFFLRRLIKMNYYCELYINIPPSKEKYIKFSVFINEFYNMN